VSEAIGGNRKAHLRGSTGNYQIDLPLDNKGVRYQNHDEEALRFKLGIEQLDVLDKQEDYNSC
jgi:hypothetical protein